MHTTLILALLALPAYIQGFMPAEIGTLVEFSYLEEQQLLAPRGLPAVGNQCPNVPGSKVCVVSGNLYKCGGTCCFDSHNGSFAGACSADQYCYSPTPDSTQVACCTNGQSCTGGPSPCANYTDTSVPSGAIPCPSSHPTCYTTMGVPRCSLSQTAAFTAPEQASSIPPPPPNATANDISVAVAVPTSLSSLTSSFVAPPSSPSSSLPPAGAEVTVTETATVEEDMSAAAITSVATPPTQIVERTTTLTSKPQTAKRSSGSFARLSCPSTLTGVGLGVGLGLLIGFL